MGLKETGREVAKLIALIGQHPSSYFYFEFLVSFAKLEGKYYHLLRNIGRWIMYKSVKNINITSSPTSRSYFM
jgi:hypothetical protein